MNNVVNVVKHLDNHEKLLEFLKNIDIYAYTENFIRIDGEISVSDSPINN